jgi:hypothetical protein
VPFAQGWGWCTVNPKSTLWADTDPRKEGSILQVGKIEQERQITKATRFHETGYWNKKYTALQHGSSTGNKGMFVQMYNWAMQISNKCMQDYLYALCGCFVNALK